MDANKTSYFMILEMILCCRTILNISLVEMYIFQLMDRLYMAYEIKMYKEWIICSSLWELIRFLIDNENIRFYRLTHHISTPIQVHKFSECTVQYTLYTLRGMQSQYCFVMRLMYDVLQKYVEWMVCSHPFMLLNCGFSHVWLYIIYWWNERHFSSFSTWIKESIFNLCNNFEHLWFFSIKYVFYTLAWLSLIDQS